MSKPIFVACKHYRDACGFALNNDYKSNYLIWVNGDWIPINVSKDQIIYVIGEIDRNTAEILHLLAQNYEICLKYVEIDEKI